jgi:hypothetical protein
LASSNETTNAEGRDSEKAMVKIFPSDRVNQPFRMTILPWRSRRGGPITNAHGAKPLGKNQNLAIIADDLRFFTRIQTSF